MSRRALTVPTLQILLSLAEGPRHGYGIKLDVEERTDGQLRLGSGTLYEAIQRLETNGWIVESAPPTTGSVQEGTRFYRLTPQGREILTVELGRLDAIVAHARGLSLLPDRSG